MQKKLERSLFGRLWGFRGLLSLVCCCVLTSGFVFGQSGGDGRMKENGEGRIKENRKIKEVENGLVANTPVVFADSGLVHYNIYDRMRFYGVPSVSVAIIHRGKTEWAKAYGLADNLEGRKAGANTLYQAASMSKSVNGVLLMELVQQGKLSLDEDIRKYLKTWNFPENDFSREKFITLRNLLSHTAGLGLHGFRGYANGAALPTINNMLDGVPPANNEAVAPLFKPGTKMEYSGGGTLITRKIIEDNVSKDYAGLIERMVLAPLGMKNSSYSQPLDRKWGNFATGYDATGKEIPGKYDVYPELAPDGLWTTAGDYAKFVVSIQRSLKKDPTALLNYETVGKMLTPVLKESGAALGVFIKEGKEEKYFWHTGANLGYRSSFYGSFSTGDGIVVLTNSDNGQALIDEIVNGVSVVYKWKDFFNPLVRKLVNLPGKTTDQYVGEYQVETPAIKISIEKGENGLELTARRSEKMYFTDEKTFFLLSSPGQTGEFIRTDGKTIDGLLIKENGKILFTAKKLSPALNEHGMIEWKTQDDPPKQGWNVQGLERLKKFIIDSTQITGFVMAKAGKLIFTYGDIEENSYLASCRKSVLALLYGEYVKKGVIRLDETLDELGIDDIGGLLPVEKKATIGDILSARSGVFHPASYPGDYLGYAPKRGSVKPGEYWLYSNWDFNLAGYIFEKLTGRNIYDEVERVLAIPLHMQDWHRSLQHKDGDTSRSVYLAYPMWFSTRDMARIGQLVLNKGKWDGQQLIGEEWIEQMLMPRTSFTEVEEHVPDYRNTGYHFGYGLMWWLWQQNSDERFRGAFSAFGSMGQSISVFPGSDIVIAYKTKDNYERETPFLSRFRVLTLAVESWERPKNE